MSKKYKRKEKQKLYKKRMCIRFLVVIACSSNFSDMEERNLAVATNIKLSPAIQYGILQMELC